MGGARATPAVKRSRLPRGVLTPQLIIDESLRLLDIAGVNGFSLPKLGKALGADPTAIYRYFPSKDDLVLAIADRLIDEALDGYTPADCWIQVIVDLAYAIRVVYRAHPAAASLTSFRTTQRPAEMRGVECLVTCVQAAGFEGDRAAVVYRAIGDFSMFWAGSEATFRSLEPEQRERDTGAWTSAYRSVDPAEHPHIHSIRDELSKVTEDAIFAEALSLILIGLQAQAPVPCTCPPGTHPLLTPSGSDLHPPLANNRSVSETSGAPASER